MFDTDKMMCVDIDTIKACMNRGGLLYKPEVESIKSNLASITQSVANYGIKILSLSDSHYGDKKHALAESELKINGGSFDLHAIVGTEEAEKIPETLLNEYISIPTDLIIGYDNLQKMIPNVKQIVVEKQAICAFYDKSNIGGNPVLYQILDILEPQDIFVYGVYTEYCVLENTMPFLVMGKNVWIIRDAIVPYNINSGMGGVYLNFPDDGDRALADMANMGARFITTEEFLRLLINNFGSL